MSHEVRWYRSRDLAPRVPVTARRALRDRVRSLLPEPSVRGKVMVVYSRQTFPKVTRRGFTSDFHGLFSEFHSVLGALAYAEAHGAAGVRIDYRSPLYVEPQRGPNWWTYFFERDLMGPALNAAAFPEVHLNGSVAKYGRYGGFSDLVQGATPYLYPMTYGLDRPALHRLLLTHVQVRREILDEVAQVVSTLFEPDAFVVGVHYRGTDATHHWTGALTHYRTEPVPYRAYADEARAALVSAGRRAVQVFVATDEIEFLEFMQREFPGRVCSFDGSPRVHADSQAVHLDRTLAVSNYEKGKSAIVDALILAATSYLVKGRSNLSDASLAFNPRLPYSFCPDVTIAQLPAA